MHCVLRRTMTNEPVWRDEWSDVLRLVRLIKEKKSSNYGPLFNVRLTNRVRVVIIDRYLISSHDSDDDDADDDDDDVDDDDVHLSIKLKYFVIGSLFRWLNDVTWRRINVPRVLFIMRADALFREIKASAENEWMKVRIWFIWCVNTCKWFTTLWSKFDDWTESINERSVVKQTTLQDACFRDLKIQQIP